MMRSHIPHANKCHLNLFPHAPRPLSSIKFGQIINQIKFLPQNHTSILIHSLANVKLFFPTIPASLESNPAAGLPAMYWIPPDERLK
jgi:hypothetical protein